MTRAPTGSRLPVRRWIGTPSQRGVVDPRLDRDHRLRVGVVGHVGQGAIALVLAAHDLRGVERLEGVEDALLLRRQRVRAERGRRLHRHEAERLEQVRDDHVAERAGRVVELRAVLDAQRLGHVDLDLGDVLGRPDRLEQPVREPEREDVLHVLLAEEVVDPEDLLLAEDRVQARVERLRRVDVGAERLLEDHLRAARGQPGVADRADDRVHRRRRDRQVEQDLRRRRRARPRPPSTAAARSRRVVGAAGHVADPADERVPRPRRSPARGRTARPRRARARRTSSSPMSIGAVPMMRKSRGISPACVSSKNPGQELARREVAGGAEQDDDVIARDRLAPSGPGFSWWPPNSLRIADSDLVGELAEAARLEPLVERGRR